MSNLLKYGNAVIKNDDKLVIDSNKLLEQMLASQKKRGNYSQKASEPDPDGFICGLDAATVEQLVSEPEVSEAEQEKISRLLEEAREQAKAIIDDANVRAEQIIARAKDEGYRLGMEKASEDARKQLSERRESLEKEYADKKAALQEEYDNLKANMEPELAETILEVVSKVTGVLAEDKKDVVLHLINSVMRNAELSKEFTIRVSEEDYKYIENNKELIYGAASPDYSIEICRDTRLSRNQCVIETDAGVFDCGLDIQLENLIQEIKILSCMH